MQTRLDNGSGGASMEAATNFPHVIQCGVPMLRAGCARNAQGGPCCSCTYATAVAS